MPYLTPDNLPTGTICRQILIPDDLDWLLIVNGALSELLSAANFEQFGSITPDEVAERFQQMFFEFRDSECTTMIYPHIFNINPLTARLITGGAISKTTNTAILFNIVVEITPIANGNTMEWDFYCAAGIYDLKVIGGKGNNFGNITPNIDGNGGESAIDWYSSTALSNVEHTYSVTVPTDGNHTLRLYVGSKNASSSNYRFYVLSITGKRTGDLP